MHIEIVVSNCVRIFLLRCKTICARHIQGILYTVHVGNNNTLYSRSENMTWQHGDKRFHIFECWKIFHESVQQMIEILRNSFLQGTIPFSLLYKHKRNTKPNVSLLLWKGWLNMYCNIKQNVYFFHVWSKLTWYFISVYTVKVIHVIDNQYYMYNRSKGSQKKEVFKECQKHSGEWRSVQSFLSPILGRGLIKIKVSLILLLFITSQCKIILTCNIIFLITFNFASYW